MKLYQINPYSGRRVTVAIDGIAVKSHWTIDRWGRRVYVEKGTKVDNEGLPIGDENENEI